MFVSFFPRPKPFFLSAVAWTALAMAFWYGFADDLVGSSSPGVVGVALFCSARSLCVDLYCALSVAIFAGAWMVLAPHPWSPWSIIGSALILFTSYFQVQVSVAINSWYGPFYDLVQAALSKSKVVTVEEFYGELSTFAGIALVAVVVGVMTRFFVSHYIFRWRTAMNDVYVANWARLRTIADPPTLSVLFGNIRRNYFRLYLNFLYFNVGRIVYLQTDVVVPYILLAPTIVAGKITLGAMNQILNAFTQVRTSFQYLVNSWSTIVELISIYQRLRGFEATIVGEPLPSIETRTEPKSL